jgi:hypothetical protein
MDFLGSFGNLMRVILQLFKIGIQNAKMLFGDSLKGSERGAFGDNQWFADFRMSSSNVIHASTRYSLDPTDVALGTERSTVQPGKGESVGLKEATLPAD